MKKRTRVARWESWRPIAKDLSCHSLMNASKRYSMLVTKFAVSLQSWTGYGKCEPTSINWYPFPHLLNVLVVHKEENRKRISEGRHQRRRNYIHILSTFAGLGDGGLSIARHQKSRNRSNRTILLFFGKSYPKRPVRGRTRRYEGVKDWIEHTPSKEDKPMSGAL